MRYLIIDPVGSYAAQIMEFVNRLELEGIAIFTSRPRVAVWEHKWKHLVGERVVATYLAEDRDLKELAAEIDRDFPEGFAGLIPWDEFSVVFSAKLAEYLDLGWNSPQVMERFRDKYVMKAWLRKQGTVRINASRVVKNAEEALSFQEELGTWPVVVKPSGGAGAMGVYFASNHGELLRYCQRVLAEDLGDVLLEEYLGGEEFAVNGLVDREGDFLITDIWLYDRRASHGIPNLYYQTIKMSTKDPAFGPLTRYAADVVEALGLTRSPVHMEVKADGRGPCLIEVGARFAGGDQPVLASKLHGRSLFELATCHYLADLPLSTREVSYERYDQCEARILSGIQPVEIPRVEEVHGVEEVEQLPSFAGFGSLRLPGMSVPVTRDLDTKSYEVYLMHPDPRQIEHDARAVRHLLRYT